ncbi:MAG: redox-sensing transcriptional repressor Rex [Clostridiaceae bacterium]|nr:redox-sensing transcriptional repressor Rex [Clostridiaceae bacterium]
MSEGKKISVAVIRRLPRYFRYLSDLLKLDIKRLSSRELSQRMGITASQIRQDLNCFGGFGQQGYGYNVENLFEEVGKILGTDQGFKCIIIGAGNMGNALANYENFKRRGFEMIGIFDVDPKKVGTYINNIKVRHMDELDDFVKENHVDIAILTVPNKYIINTAKRVTALGIKGIWNFSPTDLMLGDDVVVENVHLSDSLMVLGYNLKEKRKQMEEKKGAD